MAKQNEEKVTICVVIPKSLREAVEEIAKEEDRNLSYIVRKALQEYVDNN